MSTTLHDNGTTGVAILSRVLEPGHEALSPEAARTLLALRFQRADRRRMNRLAAKARKGTLTEKERLEAEQYNLVSHMLAFLQAKARGAQRDVRKGS
jgi:hypothetical protein